MSGSRNEALIRYAGAVLLVVVGVALAAARFPGGFDWGYTVVSRLASPRHNPAGGPWLCGALLAAVVVLWPVTAQLARAGPPGKWALGAITALRIGLLGAGLLALEGLFQLNFSGLVRKGHELVALAAFFGWYAGVLGLYLHRARHGARFAWSALWVLMPLVAVGATQLALYFDQRDLGWVDTAWRELGVPLWLSFAFWQWLAVAFLGAGLGHLIATGSAPPRSRRSPTPSAEILPQRAARDGVDSRSGTQQDDLPLSRWNP